MKKICVLFIAAGLVFLHSYKLQAEQEFSGVVNTPGVNTQSIEEYIPKAAVNADIMVLGSTSSGRLQELTAKIKEGVSSNQEWYRQYLNAYTGTLPYDYRLGVSEEEYNEYLKLGSGLRLMKSAEATVDFRWLSDTVIQIVTGPALADLNGIEIDLANDSVKTSFGILSNRRVVNNTDPNSASGPWRGVQWKLENVTTYGATSGVAVKFALGRLTDTGRGILYFNAKEVRPDGTGQKLNDVLIYDL